MSVEPTSAGSIAAVRRLAPRRPHLSPSLRALVGTVIGSLPGFVLPFALSWRLHAGRLTDAYFLSFAIATFVAGILTNVLEANVVPAATAHRRAGPAALAQFVRRTVTRSVGVAAVAYLPTAAVGYWIVVTRHSWPASEQRLCVALIAIFGIYILATTLTSILDAALYSLGQFFLPTASQCIRTLLPLAFLMLTARSDFGVIFTASLLVGGELARGALLGRILMRAIRTVEGDGSAPPPSRLLATSLPMALSLLVVAASPLIDKVVASPLGTGSVSIVELSEKVFFVPLMAITSSIILVAGTRWARLAQQDPARVAFDFRRSLRPLLYVTAAAMLAVSIAVYLATALSGRYFLGLDSGRFRQLVLLFVAGLPGAVVINHGARLMTALQRTRLLPLFALSAFTVNLAGDILGAHLWGVRGIALASTAFRSLNAALYLWCCCWMLRLTAAPRAAAAESLPFLLR